MKKPQSQASKDIKRINTNLTAIGNKYGFNSPQYLVAKKHLEDHFDSEDIVYKNGKYSVRNTKKTQSNQYAITSSLHDESMSLSGMRKTVTRSFKSQGLTKPTEKEIQDAITYGSKFEHYLTEGSGYGKDSWYKLKMSSEVTKAKQILHIKGRKKTDAEIREIVDLIEKAIKKEEEKEKKRNDLAKQLKEKRENGKTFKLVRGSGTNKTNPRK